MAGASKQKQKLLRMEQIFKTQTDENNVITGNELIEILEKEGIKAERKTIYDDIATLCDSGVTIETVKKGHSNAYFYLNREDFSAEELFILASAVASCRPFCPRAVYSTIRVVIVLTFPGLPMMEGIP